ncbi:MAG TPA: zinc-binding dehydrogenase, partial [Chitinophagaceae bacterium]|nr:zinc-binding dehydrogenase [Chitinophagaceae bacterium]
DYTKEDFTRSGKCYDLILDVKTNRSMFAYARVLCRNGVYVSVGGSIVRLLQALFLAPWIRMFQKKYVRLVTLKQNKDLAYMNALFEEGKMRPLIDGPYRLDQVPQALRIFAEGKHKGKMVIIM